VYRTCFNFPFSCFNPSQIDKNAFFKLKLFDYCNASLFYVLECLVLLRVSCCPVPMFFQLPDLSQHFIKFIWNLFAVWFTNCSCRTTDGKEKEEEGLTGPALVIFLKKRTQRGSPSYAEGGRPTNSSPGFVVSRSAYLRRYRFSLHFRGG